MLNNTSTFSDFVELLIGIMNGILAFVVALIVVVFVWRIFTAWFIGGGDPKEVARGRQSVLVGLIVLIFVLGLWGLVYIVRNTFFGI
jgi:hypothetical protein